MDDVSPLSAPSLASVVLATGEAPLFRAGVDTRLSIGHYRVPLYLRGKSSVVEGVIEPRAADNEEEGFGHNAGSMRLYYRSDRARERRERAQPDRLHACSCYPRPVLGLPPDWYKLKPYRARAVIEPRKLLAEFGTIIPEEVEIRVTDSTSMLRFLVLPMRPTGTEEWTGEQLAALVTRDAMIGVVPVTLGGAMQ